MERLKIAVLFGGLSSEYGISLQSAHGVIVQMDRKKYQPIPIGISPEGNWFYYTGPADKILRDTWCNPADCVPVAVSPSHGDHGLLLLDGKKPEKLFIDAVFPVLHGKNGEDGTVQGLFTLAGIPVVGSGVLASALCMDKERAHRLAAASGVDVPKSFVINKGEGNRLTAQAEKLGYPLFVKPLRAGSSYGVSKVSRPEDLPAAVELAFSYDSQIILEENIPGFEVGCAVLGDSHLVTGEPDEVELSQGFFDFQEKYAPKTSAIHVPARVSPEIKERIKETARKIYRVLGCSGFARVDMFLTPGGEIVFNEVNTIPGFTAHSRYPAMMQAAGIPFAGLISKLIELAITGDERQKGAVENGQPSFSEPAASLPF